MPKVIIVDKEDNVIGAMNKAEAVDKEHIVRIVRVFLFNSKGQLFVQKRGSKVIFPNLLDQSVGGHVDEGEDYITAAYREMKEEIGIIGVKLEQIAKYYSSFEYDNGKFKRFNMLYIAKSDKPITLDPDEVASGSWFTPEELEKMMKSQSNTFTQGFIKAYGIYKQSVS